MISYLFYDIRVAQERQSYDIIYDIMAFFMISHMILHMKLASKPWYHVWYHIIYDFIYDIINDTYLKSCMISYMILYMISTENLWCHVWYHSKYDIIYDVIHDIMMAWLTCHSLQPPIVPRHSVLKQAMLIMIQTDQWILTRSVTLLIKALSQIWIWRKMPRCSHFCWSTCPLALTQLTLNSYCETFLTSRR